MKKLVLFTLLLFWLAAGKSSAQTTTAVPDQLDSLLYESLSDPSSADLADIFFQVKGMMDKAKDYSFLNGNLQVLDQGNDICLISNARERLQVFISNYRVKPRDFSVVLYNDEEKYVYLINKNGDGGYYKNCSEGYLVFKSLFMSNERFRPMSANEIFYFNERVIKLLYLIKKATD